MIEPSLKAMLITMASYGFSQIESVELTGKTKSSVSYCCSRYGIAMRKHKNKVHSFPTANELKLWRANGWSQAEACRIKGIDRAKMCHAVREHGIKLVDGNQFAKAVRMAKLFEPDEEIVIHEIVIPELVRSPLLSSWV